MILSRDDFFLNEAKLSKKDIKKTLRGTLGRTDRAMLRKLLRHNIVTFKFVKRDESIRKAKGTLYPSYLPALRGGAPKPEHQFVYYDLDKHHWRSFRTFTFIKVLDIKPISSKSMSSKAEELEAEDEEEMKKKGVKEVDLEKEEREKEKEKERELEKKHKESEKKEKEVPKKPEKDDHKEEHHEVKDKKVEKEHHSEKEEPEEDEKKKTFKAGEKMSEKELLRRSSDFRKGSRKNKLTKEANDKFKNGELADEPKEKKHNDEESHSGEKHHSEEKESKHGEEKKHNEEHKSDGEHNEKHGEKKHHSEEKSDNHKEEHKEDKKDKEKGED